MWSWGNGRARTKASYTFGEKDLLLVWARLHRWALELVTTRGLLAVAWEGRSVMTGEALTPSDSARGEINVPRQVWLRRTPIAAVLATPWLCRFLVLLAVAQFGEVASGSRAWACPSSSLLARPCLGCGLSWAGAALLGGEIGLALELHAFVLVAVPQGLLILLSSLL